MCHLPFMLDRFIISLAVVAVASSFAFGCVGEATETEPTSADVAPLPDDAGPAPALTSHPAPFAHASYCEAHPDIPACSDGGVDGGAE